jgi:hypothetical protein
LEIDFLNGTTYKYLDVPVEVYKELADYKNVLQKVGSGLKKLFKPTTKGVSQVLALFFV